MQTILITSGGTKVYIDEVRHIGNMSSGRFGSDIAREALKNGHKVIYLCAKDSIRPDRETLDLTKDPDPYWGIQHESHLLYGIRNSLTVITYRDFDDYAAKLQEVLEKEKPNITMLAAAVSDYGMPATGGKISSDKDEITFTMTRNPKLITRVKEWCPTTFLVGFKLLVGVGREEKVTAAVKQIESAGSDMVVVNDLHDIKRNNHRLMICSDYHNVTPVAFNMRVEEIESDLAKNLLNHIFKYGKSVG